MQLEDVEELTELISRNRDFLAPWEPKRPAEFFTVAGQRALLEIALTAHAQGTSLPHVVVDGDGRIVGRITLNGIVRGPFLSCSVGYWIDQDQNGRGIATRALAHIKHVAFGELGLHRLQAETLEHNVASQRVLARNGFERIGFAPAYLNIAGRWQDHILFQVTTPTGLSSRRRTALGRSRSGQP